MDEGYIGRKSKNWLLPIIILGIAIVVGSGIFIWSKSQKMVSPIPPKPSFEVIFYTPTPIPATPTSTPSATPKIKKSPTITPLPTIKVATPSVTIKATVTPK